METKNFLGLDGLNHFWEKAKIWIINEITAKIAGIVLSSVPTGTVLSGLYTTVPNGFLLCDGTAYLKTAYPGLLAAIGTIYTLPTDGGDVFRVPDYRECALVGAGQNGIFPIATHDVYGVGEFKDDQIQNITGSLKPRTSELTIDMDMTGTGAIVAKSETREISGYDGGKYSAWAGFDFDASRVARTGETTHGKQIGVNFIIKY